MSAWLEYEKLAAQIYTELDPSTTVTHNDKIKGLDSGIERQIDISIRSHLASHDLLIIIQARNHKKPLDVIDIDSFASVVKDVRASKGVLICNSGFSKAAKDYAISMGIDLCKLHDAQSRNWSLDVRIPLLWIDLLPSVMVELVCFLEAGDAVAYDPRSWVLSTDKGKTRLLLFETFERKWNAGELDRRFNITHNFLPAQVNIQLLVNNKENIHWRPVKSLILTYTVSRKAWLGYLSPTECRGILNFIKDEFTPSYFKIGDTPIIKDESWVPIEDPDKIAVNTKGIFITTQHYQVSPANTEFKPASFQRMTDV